MADTFGVQAETIVGLGIEHTVGHYKAPQKLLPITSESLSVTNETVEGRELTGTPDVSYAKPGNESVEGSIEMDAKHDCIPWLLTAMRGEVTSASISDRTKYPSGVFAWSFKPDGRAVPKPHLQDASANTLSVTIRRAGEMFLYTGVKINRLSFDVNDGLLSMSMDVSGLNESGSFSAEDLKTLMSATDPLKYTLTPPWGAGEYGIFIPHTKQNYGTDSFNLEIDDGGETLFRLRDDKRTPTINKWGERSITSSNELDFIDKTEYQKYRDVDDSSLRYFCEFAERGRILVDRAGLPGSSKFRPSLNLFLPKVYLNDYSVDTSGGQGDLVRASGSYMGIRPEGEWSPVLPAGVDALTFRDGELYHLLVITNESISWPVESVGAPTNPDLGILRSFEFNAPATKESGFSGFVIRYRPKGSSVFDWKVRTVGPYTGTTTPNLVTVAAGQTFALGENAPAGTTPNVALGHATTPVPGSGVFDASELSSGVTYEIQVAQWLNGTGIPGSGTLSAWSALDDTKIS